MDKTSRIEVKGALKKTNLRTLRYVSKTIGHIVLVPSTRIFHDFLNPHQSFHRAIRPTIPSAPASPAPKAAVGMGPAPPDEDEPDPELPELPELVEPLPLVPVDVEEPVREPVADKEAERVADMRPAGEPAGTVLLTPYGIDEPADGRGVAAAETTPDDVGAAAAAGTRYVLTSDGSALNHDGV